MGGRHQGGRQRARLHSFERPWIARDHAGAPGWAIIVTGVVLVGVAVFAVVPR